MRHIAIYVPSLVSGGLQRTILNLANGFATAGLEVDLVLMQAKGEYLPLVQSDVRIVDLGAGRAMTSIVSLARYLRRERPDVLLTGLSR